ncbi:MAG: hypothetical protein JWM21_1178 [Acidobacteria bacterium]|nr:hypothetical protein [Acidobacteriota bacterium]
MKRTLITAFIITIALATQSGTRGRAASISTLVGAQSTDLTELQKASADEIREEFHQSYPLSANGRVSVENINGGVRIAVWDQNEVKVDAVKRAYRRERLEEAKIEVSATADSVRIKTGYPDRDQMFTDEEGRRSNNPASVEYSLTIPRRARIESVEVINGSLDIDGAEGDVKASSINGYVKARALMGEVRLSTVNGGLEATFTQLDTAKPVTLNSVNGNIALVIPSDANAQLRAGTVHGGVSNDFGLPVIDGEYVGHELFGQIGTGGPRIKLGNVNGRITIKRAGDGRTLSPSTNLQANKEKHKGDKSDTHMQDLNEEIREATRAATRVQVDVQRLNRDEQIEIQREVERSIRESQREVERAQREIQRTVQRQVREQTREPFRNRAGAGKGNESGWGRFIDRESKSFPVSGTPSVKISTYDGAVTIRAWDKPEVSYTAVKRANHEESLKNISIEASQQGSSISIIANTTNKGTDDDGSTALEVFVPRSANLNFSSDDGHLSVQGVSGELVARSGDGSIEVDGGQGRLKANTEDGRIRVTGFQGEVDARTGDGSITLEGTFTGLQAHTGDGSIVLGVPADSNFVIETNAEEVSNEGLNISEEAAPSARVKRWKVGRGGAVFTLNTGDGHVILRQR